MSPIVRPPVAPSEEENAHAQNREEHGYDGDGTGVDVHHAGDRGSGMLDWRPATRCTDHDHPMMLGASSPRAS